MRRHNAIFFHVAWKSFGEGPPQEDTPNIIKPFYETPHKIYKAIMRKGEEVKNSAMRSETCAKRKCLPMFLTGQQFILGTTVTMTMMIGREGSKESVSGCRPRCHPWREPPSPCSCSCTLSVCSSGTSLSFPEAESNGYTCMYIVQVDPWPSQLSTM